MNIQSVQNSYIFALFKEIVLGSTYTKYVYKYGPRYSELVIEPPILHFTEYTLKYGVGEIKGGFDVVLFILSVEDICRFD